MSFAHRHLLDIESVTQNEIESIFRLSDAYAANFIKYRDFLGVRQHRKASEPGFSNPPKIIACVFFEASTRTRLSFQVAAYRLGAQVTSLEAGPSSSLVKGETLEDTILNIAAMAPDALVIRYGNDDKLDALLPLLPFPVINAGSGIVAHPTQALLDAYTIRQTRGKISGERVLIFGDIAHSRVAVSNIKLLKRLGADVGIAGPSAWLSNAESIQLTSGIRIFASLEEGLSWSTVCMGLRIQNERHSTTNDYSEGYNSHFGLNSERLKTIGSESIILHPGPINHGVEFTDAVLKDSRCKVLSQVENGVFIRAAVLAIALDQTIESCG